MSRCLLTGATGFVGKHLVEALLNAGHDLTLLVRNPESQQIYDWLNSWNTEQNPQRITVQKFDLEQADFALKSGLEWLNIDHVYHLAAIYNLDADPAQVLATNVQGTRHLLEKLHQAEFTGAFHFVSSIAVAGDFNGSFDEMMFDEGQQHSHVYHQSKFQSEALVREFREQASFKVMIYRPSAIVGHSKTGYIDKIDGPYYLFTLISLLKRWVPGKVPLPVFQTQVALDMVPVDYVVAALLNISQHQSKTLSAEQFCFHLTNPDSPSLSDLFQMLLKLADGPAIGLTIPIDGITKFAGIPQLKLALQLKAIRMLKKELFSLIGIPESVTNALMPKVTFSADRTRALLAGTDIQLPPVETYLEHLWDYYAKHLDPYKNRIFYAKKTFKGKRIIITGGSSGIGFEAAKIAYGLGAHVLLVARNTDKLKICESELKHLTTEGGQVSSFSCDLSEADACDQLIRFVQDTFGGVDILFSNAGRSIRRSVAKSEGRFHDLERTMQLNYFGAARLILGLIPCMKRQGGGHIIHSSSMGTLSATPRFGPYMASKIALDTLMDSMAAEFANHNIHFSSIKFPLVKTPMVAPTAAFKKAKLTSPEQAAKMFMDTVIDKNRHKMTATGSLLGFVAWVSPNFMTQLYNYGFQIWPDETTDFPEMAMDRMLMKYFIPYSPL